MKKRLIVAGLLSSLLFLSCSDDEETVCITALDCSGNQLCVDGQCISDNSTGNSTDDNIGESDTEYAENTDDSGDIVDMDDSGDTTTDMDDSGDTTTDMDDSGDTTTDMDDSGDTTTDMDDSGDTTTDMDDSGDTTTDMDDSGDTTTDMDDSGDTTTDMDDSGDTTTEIIPNYDFSQWSGSPEMPVGWAPGDYTTPVISFVKFSRSTSDYALNVSHSSYTSNIYVFTTESFNAVDALPTKIKFELATDQTSKMSVNIKCNNVQTFYNFDTTAKIFKNSGQNAYNAVDFGNTDFNETWIEVGSELTSSNWNSATKCILEFKSGKGVDFNVKIDNVTVEF